METASFALRPTGLSGVNELCLFLADMERTKRIADWHFARHTDADRSHIAVAFTRVADAEIAHREWSGRVGVSRRV